MNSDASHTTAHGFAESDVRSSAVPAVALLHSPSLPLVTSAGEKRARAAAQHEAININRHLPQDNPPPTLQPLVSDSSAVSIVTTASVGQAVLTAVVPSVTEKVQEANKLTAPALCSRVLGQPGHGAMIEAGSEPHCAAALQGGGDRENSSVLNQAAATLWKRQRVS